MGATSLLPGSYCLYLCQVFKDFKGIKGFKDSKGSKGFKDFKDLKDFRGNHAGHLAPFGSKTIAEKAHIHRRTCKV